MDFPPRCRAKLRFPQVLPLALLALISCSAGATPVLGQRGDREDPENAPDVFVPASRDLQLQLNRARKAMEEGSFADAADLLGSLIATPEGDRFSPEAEDYFLDSAEGGGTFRSLKSEVLKLLGEMPTKGREAYEIRFGAEARALVEEAVETGNIEKLTEAARKYFHTRAGYEAMLLLARFHLIQGRPLAAAFCAQRVVDSRGAVACEPEASVLLAASWWNAGYPDRAQTALTALRRKAPRAQVKINGRPKPLFTSDDRALDWLREILPETAASGSVTQDNWVMHRGDPMRNAESKGGAPVRTPIWQALPVFDPEDEALLREIERNYRDQGTPLVSVLHPLAIGDDIIMRLPDRLIALDFATGKAKWEYPWDDSIKSLGPSLESSRNQTNDRDRRRRHLTRRLWEDSAYGQLSSDGENIYFLDSMDSSGLDVSSMFNLGQRRLRFDMPGTANTLVCLELQSEGRQKWVVGGASGEDEPRLAGAWFLGPPLALQGDVYVLAEMTGEVRLVVLDADTGELQWWQQLCLVDDYSPIRHDQERQLAGCTPSFADGVLVCPTNAGAIVAVDIAARSLIWGHRYQGVMQRRATAFSVNMSREVGKRWADCTATIADGKVIVCTPDTDELHCLDLFTGKRIWGPTRRNDALYVACVRNDAVYLVHAESMTALRMSDATSAWQSAISLKDSRPSGRGFIEGNHYYLPVESSQILKIDLTRGEIVERIPTAFPLGNLICHRDAVIAQSTLQWLSLFHQLAPLRENVAARLAANPKDAWALARQGEILAHDGKPREAIEALKASLAIDPKSRSTRSILARTMLSLLREDFAGNPDLAKEAAKYVDRPEERAEFLQLELNGLMQSGEFAEAFDRLMQLVIDSDRPGAPHLGQLIQPPGDPARQVTKERWRRGLLFALWNRGSDELRKQMTLRIAAEAAKLDENPSGERLSRFVEMFGGVPGSEKPLVRLIQLETAASNYLRAEMLIELLRQYNTPAARATADALAYDLAVISRQPEMAFEAHRALEARREPLTLLDGRTPAEVIRGKTPPSTLPAVNWPQGAVQVERLEEQRLGFGAPPIAAHFRVIPSDARGANDIAVVRIANSAIQVRDRFGNDMTQVPLDRLPIDAITDSSQIRFTARRRGNYLLLWEGAQILAIDLHRSAVESDSVLQWNVELVQPRRSTYQGAGAGRRSTALPNRSPLEKTPPKTEIVHTSVDRPMGLTSDIQVEGICFHRRLELVCVSPLTGKVMWERKDVPLGFDLYADERILIACDRDVRLVRRFRLTDGEELPPVTLGEQERVWAGLGSRVLTYQPATGGKTIVRLWSFAEDSPRLAWSQEMPARSLGCLIDGVEAALLDPNGELTIYPLDESRPPIKTTIDVSDGMAALQMQRSSDAYYVYLHAPPRANTTEPSPPSATVPLRANELFHGSLIALDRKDGRPLWPSAARIDQNGLIADTAPDAPVLVFAKGTRSSRLPRTMKISLLVIDKATGRKLFEQVDLGLRSQNPYCRVEVHPELHEVEVFLPVHEFSGIKLTYTDEPRPPEPPAQTGEFGVTPPPAASSSP